VIFYKAFSLSLIFDTYFKIFYGFIISSNYKIRSWILIIIRKVINAVLAFITYRPELKPNRITDNEDKNKSSIAGSYLENRSNINRLSVSEIITFIPFWLLMG